MKLYHHLTQCRFLCRVNRFIARCEVEGTATDVHVKNTGRLRELLIPGATVWLEHSDAPQRKTCWDLVAVLNRGYVVNVDSQAPNPVFGEWLAAGRWAEDIKNIRGEYTLQDSRYDFTYERILPGGAIRRGLVEVKGVTLIEDDRIASFPDAPTSRGVKHLEGLIRAARAGMDTGVCFVIQREDVRLLRPNTSADPAFAAALREAHDAGVRIEAAVCRVSPEECTITHAIPVEL